MECCKSREEWKKEGKSKGYWFHYQQEVIDDYLEGKITRAIPTDIKLRHEKLVSLLEEILYKLDRK